MTKQETIFKVSGWYSKGYLPDNIPSKYALEAMDEYAKQQSLFFQVYLSRFNQEANVRTMRMYQKAGGIFTHRGSSLEDIYKDFTELKPIPSEAMEGFIYYFHTGKETNNLVEVIEARKQFKQ